MRSEQPKFDHKASFVICHQRRAKTFQRRRDLERRTPMSYINKSHCRSRRFGSAGGLSTDRHPEFGTRAAQAAEISAIFAKHTEANKI
jgi:hypothetical protein